MTVTYHKLLFAAPKTKMSSEPEMSFAPFDQVNLSEVNRIPALRVRPEGLRYGSREAELLNWGITDDMGSPIVVIRSGSSCLLSMCLTCHQDIEDMSVGFAIKDRKGTVVWGITNLSQDKRACVGRSGDIITVSCSCTMWLAAGEFFVTLGIAHLEDGEKIDFIEDAIQFTIVGPGDIFTTSLVNIEGKLSISNAVLF